MRAENQEHAFATLLNLFMSLTDEQICFISQQNPPCSYILIGNRVRIKSSGMAPGLANARPRAAQNLQMPHPRD